MAARIQSIPASPGTEIPVIEPLSLGKIARTVAPYFQFVALFFSWIVSRFPSPLHLAIRDNHESMALWMIAKNLFLQRQNDWCQTPIHYAISNGRLSVVQELLQKEDIDINASFTINGYTPLITALHNSQTEIALFLLNQGANLQLEQALKRTLSPNTNLSSQDRVAIVRLLLEKNTPLPQNILQIALAANKHFSSQDRVAVVQLLLEKNAPLHATVVNDVAEKTPELFFILLEKMSRPRIMAELKKITEHMSKLVHARPELIAQAAVFFAKLLETLDLEDIKSLDQLCSIYSILIEQAPLQAIVFETIFPAIEAIVNRPNLKFHEVLAISDFLSKHPFLKDLQGTFNEKHKTELKRLSKSKLKLDPAHLEKVLVHIPLAPAGSNYQTLLTLARFLNLERWKDKCQIMAREDRTSFDLNPLLCLKAFFDKVNRRVPITGFPDKETHPAEFEQAYDELTNLLRHIAHILPTKEAELQYQILSKLTHGSRFCGQRWMKESLQCYGNIIDTTQSVSRIDHHLKTLRIELFEDVEAARRRQIPDINQADVHYQNALGLVQSRFGLAAKEGNYEGDRYDGYLDKQARKKMLSHLFELYTPERIFPYLCRQMTQDAELEEELKLWLENHIPSDFDTKKPEVKIAAKRILMMEEEDELTDEDLAGMDRETLYKATLYDEQGKLTFQMCDLSRLLQDYEIFKSSTPKTSRTRRMFNWTTAWFKRA